jgi:uncharacterized protein YbjQ (UPF0145 family)
MEAFAELWQFLIIILLLILAFFTGSIAERRHYKSIIRREDALGDIVVVVAKTLPPANPAPATTLVRGSVVISVDYFKRFLARLRMIFGGRIHTYESLLDRARREAILRMQEQAREAGARCQHDLQHALRDQLDLQGPKGRGRHGRGAGLRHRGNPTGIGA